MKSSEVMSLEHKALLLVWELGPWRWGMKNIEQIKVLRGSLWVRGSGMRLKRGSPWKNGNTIHNFAKERLWIPDAWYCLFHLGSWKLMWALSILPNFSLFTGETEEIEWRKEHVASSRLLEVIAQEMIFDYFERPHATFS